MMLILIHTLITLGGSHFRKHDGDQIQFLLIVWRVKKNNQEVEHKHNAINGLTDDQFVKDF